MKNLFIMSFLLLTLNLSSNELAWVDEQVNAIKPPRTGVKSSVISRLRNPFIFLHKKSSTETSTTRRSIPNGMLSSSSKTKAVAIKKTIKTNLVLDATMNHSALIGGKWYKINDKVGAYTLESVNTTSVVLTNKDKRLVLSTNSKNLTLKFKNK